MNDPFDLPPDVLRRIPLFAELAKVLSWRGGPVNWDLARQIAVSVAAGEDPPASVDAADHAALAEQVRLAEMWLAEATGLPAPTELIEVRAGTPVDWAEAETPSFAELIDPVAAKVSHAMTDQLPGDEETAPIAQALAQMGPMFMGIQAGTVLGTLAREVLGTHEVPLPVGEGPTLLIAPSIDRLAAEHGLERSALRQWVALRAAARRMTLEGFAWIRAHFFALYHNFVATLDVTIAEGIQRLEQLDFSDPARLQEALGDAGLFTHEPSPQTAQATARIARFLAVLGAHATVAVEAAGARLGPDAFRLAEIFARRVAAPGTGLRSLGGFVGLESDGESRRALGFARGTVARGGWETLHRLFEDADAFPTDAELDDPETWIARVTR